MAVGCCFCFLSMLYVFSFCDSVVFHFSFRLNSDQIFWPLPSSPMPLVPKRDMVRLSNPYVLRLEKLETAELQGIEMVCYIIASVIDRKNSSH